MKTHWKLIYLFFIAITPIFGQVTEEILPPPYIRTIEFKSASNEFSGTPVMSKGEFFSISFDDITGDESDYYYKITHYNFDWTPSALAKSEYMDGFDDIRIFNYENSLNSLQIYSHYTLSIPNEDTKALKVSGNYLLEIYNDDEEIVFTKKFILYESIASVKVAAKRSRDLRFVDSRQVVQFSITPPDNLILRNPKATIKTLVIQNNNLKQAIKNLKPQYTTGQELIYRYDQEASFSGSNEFLNFDNKELRVANIGVRWVELKDIYHHHLFTTRARVKRGYTFFQDINGNFVVRNLRATNSAIEAEYVWMHFSLEFSEINDDEEIHIYGNFNNFNMDETTKMSFNKATGLHEGKRLFKQGFYNYNYVLKRQDGTIDQEIISGSYDETENEYVILAYYSPPGARYDKVIGRGVGNSNSIRN